MIDLRPRTARQHILTVEVEDYFQVGAFRAVVPHRHWHRFESRVAANTVTTLDLLDQHGARATFFVLGWTAEAMPEVVREIARRGHEVACKGHDLRSGTQMSVDEFRADALRARDAVEQAAGVAVRGYRVSRGRLRDADLWALDVLAEIGFEYDSSVKPMLRDFAGEPHRRFVHRHESGKAGLWEVPVSSLGLGGWSLPIAGGNYMRQLPRPFVESAIERWDAAVPHPLVLYFHIWDLDPDQPRIASAARLDRMRQYRNLETFRERLSTPLARYRFGTIADALALREVAPVARKPSVVAARAVNASVTGERTPVTIVVPCYNEAETLPYLSNTLGRLNERMGESFDLSFVFVDDGSKDATWELLHKHFGQDSRCTLVKHEINRGITAATLTGISHAKTEIVCAMDCDCTYDPEQFGAMIALLADNVDLVTASPYHPSGEVMNVPAWRLALSRTLSRLYRLVLRHKLATYTSCFRVYRRSSFADMPVQHYDFLGIAELLARIDLKGGCVIEHPAVLESRTLGRSKMKVVRTIMGHLRLLAQIGAMRWSNRT